ncbi:hypothetical protein PIB30_020321 [Stylosanthes scabra]|uniref:Uncharacterized protein n=1 Tax=Stylosanthes scabra TaxID=79078 RepID=A0ABU6X5W8_9FABA|nr:hypothetical protein [Stylosanthes scabra]
MNNTSLRGKKMFVEETRTRRDNKHLVEHKTRYQVVYDSVSRDELVQGTKVVHGREWDLSAELVMMDRGDDGEQDEKTVITKEILDKWKFLDVEKCPFFVLSNESDLLAEIVMLKRNKVEEDQGVSKELGKVRGRMGARDSGGARNVEIE